MKPYLNQQVLKAGIEFLYHEKVVELVALSCDNITKFNVFPPSALRLTAETALGEIEKLHHILDEMQQLKEAYDRQ